MATQQGGEHDIILVVEDNVAILRGLAELLHDAGYEVMEATNGSEALEKMEKATPSLIISDIMMPVMDGYDFYRKVRDEPRWINIPFLFLTAKTEEEDIIKGLSMGVEDYITKPFDMGMLLARVRARIKRAYELDQAAHARQEEVRQEIINVLSHELRTPLTYIVGYTDLALSELSSLQPDEFEDFLQGIKRGSERLRRLVEDLLVVVKLESGQLEEQYRQAAIRYEELATLLQHFVRMQRYQHQEQDVQIIASIPPELPPVMLDEGIFIDALGRLIDNAFKFSSPGSHVYLTAEADEEEVRIAVRDEGIGINPEEMGRLFHRFGQINRKEHEQQGAGMGLYIAHAFVKMMGGTITVQSQVGEGSTFTIHLPIVP